jgi:HEAT repeat protein
VFAVQNIGGDDVAPLLLKYLPVVDDDNKGLIIFTLGRFRYARALPKMIEMLESRSAGRTKRAKNEIMIKLCEAMARIGAPQAAPVLEKISQAKGFLSITGYDSPVRAAAAKALSEIRGGQ